MVTTTRYRHVLLTRYDARTYDTNKDMVRPNTGRAMFTEIGHCLRDGGRVQLETYYEGDNEYADAVLTWDTRRAQANRRRRSSRRANK